MKHFTPVSVLPILPLYEEFKNLLDNRIIQWNGRAQICVNSIPGHEDDTSFGAGSLLYDWADYYDNKKSNKSQMDIKLREVPLKEEDFTKLCTPFKGTLFEEIYSKLKIYYNLGRIRIMESKPKTCLTWHTDPSTRLHFPLKTQDGCLMIIEDEVMHIPQNEWWHTNTKVQHTALNGSKESRYHLVVSLIGQ